MNTFASIALAAAVAVYVVDVSGFTESWRRLLARWLQVKALRPLPPFDCGKCASFWTGIVTAAVLRDLTLATAAFSALCSLLALPAGQVMLFIREGLTQLIGRLWTTLK